MGDQDIDIAGDKVVNDNNCENTDNSGDALCNIEAENAALKVKIKQEYDRACAIVRDSTKIDRDVEFAQRDVQKLDELTLVKEQEAEKLENETAQIAVSRQHIQKNTENLKKQFELLQIDTKQKQAERDKVRTNYETMIRYQNDIYNSYPSVIEKNNLENACLAYTVQQRVLEQRIENTDRQTQQMREIQDIKLKQAIIEFAKAYVDARKLYERKYVLTRQIGKNTTIMEELNKKNSDNTIIEKQVEPIDQSGNRNRRDGSPVASLLTPVKHTYIPDITAVERNSDLFSYLRQITSLKKNRSIGVLPPLLSRSYSPKSNDSCPKRRQNTPTEKREIRSPRSNPSKRLRVETAADVAADKRLDDTTVPIDVDNTKESSPRATKTVSGSDLEMSADSFVLDVSNPKEASTAAVTLQLHNVNLSHVSTPSHRSLRLSPIPKDPPILLAADGKNSSKSKIPISKARNSSIAGNVSIASSAGTPMVSSVQTFVCTSKWERPAISEKQAAKTRRVLMKENFPRVSKQTTIDNSVKVAAKPMKISSFLTQSKVSDVKAIPAKERKPTGSEPDCCKQSVSQVVRRIEEKSSAQRGQHSVHRKMPQGVGVIGEHACTNNTKSTNTACKHLDIVQDGVRRPGKTSYDSKQKSASTKCDKQWRPNLVTSPGQANESSAAKRTLQEQSRCDLISRDIENVTIEGVLKLMKRGLQPQFLQKVDQELQMRIANADIECNDQNYGDSGGCVESRNFIPVRKDDHMEENEESEDRYSKYFMNEKQVLEKNDRNLNSAQQSYDENYESNNEGMYASPTEDAPSNRNLSPSEIIHSKRFSPSSDGYSFSAQGVENTDMANLFASSNDDAAFGFTSSVNQIFGSNDQPMCDNTGQRKEPFTLNFSESSNISEGFQLFF